MKKTTQLKIPIDYSIDEDEQYLAWLKENMRKLFMDKTPETEEDLQ